MIPVRSYSGRRVAVLGLGEAGLAGACALVEGGADVSAWDDRVEHREKAQALGVLVENLTQFDWGDLAVLVVEDASLIAHDHGERLIDMARALDVPVIAARTLLAEAVIDSPDHRAVIITGRNSQAAASFSQELLVGNGQLARHLIETDLTRLAAKTVLCVLTGDELMGLNAQRPVTAVLALRPDENEDASAIYPVLKNLCAGEGTTAIVAAQVQERSSLIAGHQDPNAIAVSGRMILTRGVYAAGTEVFNALEGRAERLGMLDPLWPAEAIAASIALALKLGVEQDSVRQQLIAWPGVERYGRLIFQRGRVWVYDWSGAASADHVFDALKGSEPIYWICGPELDPHAAKLFRLIPSPVQQVYFAGDRKKVERKLSRHVKTVRLKNLSNAFARALHDAAKAGGPVRIVYAPGSPVSAQCDAFGDVFDALCTKALKGKVA